MKLKKSLALLALVMPFTASAIPITWELMSIDKQFNPGPSGVFTFDADSEEYSDVNISGVFGTDYTALSGDASKAWGESSGYLLNLDFILPLSNAWHLAGGFYSETSAIFLPKLNIISVIDVGGFQPPHLDQSHGLFLTLRPTNVPEPGTIALLGLGLLATGFARRTRS